MMLTKTKFALAASLTAMGMMTVAHAENEIDGMDREEMMEERDEAQARVREAATVIEQMKGDPELAQLMSQAEGIFVMPDYGRAALMVGAAGGEGILVSRQASGWSAPVFYNVAALSGGLEVGIEAGQVALLLMTPDAVESFQQENNFSISADAGLTLVDYSARTEASLGKGDVIIWSDTEGAFANASLRIQDIMFDSEETSAYYGEETTPTKVMTGDMMNEPGETETLKGALET